MTTVRCPRCRREAPELTAFCVGCGAPLLLRDDRPAGPLDVPVDLDRRTRGARAGERAPPPLELPAPAAAEPPPPRGPGPRHGELADVERSSWDLGPLVAAAPRPEPVPRPAVKRSVTASPRTAPASPRAPSLPPATRTPPPPAPPPATRTPPPPTPRTPPPPAPAPAPAPATPTATPTAPATPTATATSPATRNPPPPPPFVLSGASPEATRSRRTGATPTSASTSPTPSSAPTALGEAIAETLDDLPDADVDAVEVHVARAESWRRVVAWAIDGIPFLAGGGAVAFSLLREAGAARGGPPDGVLDLVELVSAERVIVLSIVAAVAVVLGTYATLAHALGGATLGKRLVGIRVVGPDGAPPSPARSAIRSLLAMASAALLGLGFVLALFTRTGRALHDVLARTWVVKAP